MALRPLSPSSALSLNHVNSSDKLCTLMERGPELICNSVHKNTTHLEIPHQSHKVENALMGEESDPSSHPGPESHAYLRCCPCTQRAPAHEEPADAPGSVC